VNKNEASLLAASGVVILVGIASFYYSQESRYSIAPITSIITSVDNRLPTILPVEEMVLPPLMEPELAFVSSVTEIEEPLPEIVFEDTLPEILPPLTEYELPPLQGEV
tara:strand:- start:1496 stop:1819 length:324 start_codon:yes stop_codon:yes gene_type:complete